MNDPRLIGFSVLLSLLWGGVAFAWLLHVAKDRARRVSTLVMIGFALAFGPFAFSKNGGDPPTRSGEAPSASATCTVKFDANGGTGTMADQVFTRDVAGELAVNAFTKADCTFQGWSTAKDGAVVYADGASVKNLVEPGQTATLYASWKKNETPQPPAPATCTVKFNANGGKLAKGKKMAAQTMKVGKAAKLRKNVFTRSGYVFIGWSKSKTGAVVYADAQAVKNVAKAGKTVTLYAQWAKKSYKVTFYANGGKGKMTAQTMTYGKAKKLSANKFKKKGCVFKGWAKSKALAKKGKIAYKNKKAVKNLVKNGKTVKLYAVWKKK